MGENVQQRVAHVAATHAPELVHQPVLDAVSRSGHLLQPGRYPVQSTGAAPKQPTVVMERKRRR